MKKFFYFSIIALCFTACGGDIIEETPIFMLKYYNADGQLVDLNNGQSINITKFDVEGGQPTKLLFKGVILSEEGFTLEVKATRYQYEGASDDFCIGQCIPGNSEAMQVFSDFSINEDEVAFSSHFGAEKSGNYKIDYEFYEKEKPNVKIKVMVTYEYYPEN